jgi:NADPH-dependent glutamate synthase beta subunit-like oxidoreductase
VGIRCGTHIGRDIAIHQSRADHDGVLLVVGLHLGRSTRIPGSEHPHVASAVELLRRITLGESLAVSALCENPCRSAQGSHVLIPFYSGLWSLELANTDTTSA